MYVCVCLGVCKGDTQGVQRINAIKLLPIHDMSDIVIQPRETQARNTGNTALLIPTRTHTAFMTDKVQDGSDILGRWTNSGGWLVLLGKNVHATKVMC